MLTYEFGDKRKTTDPASLIALKGAFYVGIPVFLATLPETILYLLKFPFFTSHASLFHYFPMLTGASYFVGMLAGILCNGDIQQSEMYYSYAFSDAKAVIETGNPIYVNSEYALLAYKVSSSKEIITRSRIGDNKAFQSLLENGLLTQLTFGGKDKFKNLLFNQKGLVPFTSNYVLNDNIYNVILKDDDFFLRFFYEIESNGFIPKNRFVRNEYDQRMLSLLKDLKVLTFNNGKGERYEWYKENYYK